MIKVWNGACISLFIGEIDGREEIWGESVIPEAVLQSLHLSQLTLNLFISLSLLNNPL